MSGTPERVDVLIVGSGVAAAAVAHELLSTDPDTQILMLEAGPRVEMKDFRMWEDFLVTRNKPYAFCEDMAYPSKDTPGQNQSAGATQVPLRGSRLMIYGGSTVHWGGWSFRLKPEDFRLHANTGHGVDWPFDYAQLEPHYHRAECFIGVSGDGEDSPVPRTEPYPFPAFPFTLEDWPVMKAMDALGIGYNHLPIARHGITDTDSPYAPCMTTGTCKYCPFGARFVAGNTLDLMRSRHPALEVRYHCVVDRLLMADRRKALGCEYTNHHLGTTHVVHAGRVVVCAGAIESPKLLLRSRTRDWPQGVGNDRDLIGRNLITHPYFIIQADLPSNARALRPEMDFPTLCSRHFDSPEEQQDGKFILINPPSSPAADIAGLMQAGKSRQEIEAALTGPTTVQMQGMLEVFSYPENRLANLDQTNQFGLPETVVNYSKAGGFDRRMGQIVTRVGEIFEQMGASNTTLVAVSWRADHAACTLRMAADPHHGVVDANQKVHEVDNLYVSSNAVFASLGTVNPTLTLTALSLRLGQHLAEDRR